MKEIPQAQRKRISRACDFCHNRGLRCLQQPSDQLTPLISSINPTTPACRTCQEYNVQCTTARPLKRRGRPRKLVNNASSVHIRNTTDKIPPSVETSQIIPQAAEATDEIQQLVDVFAESIQPSYPLLDEVTIRKIIESQTNKSSCDILRLSVLTMGALVVSTRSTDTFPEPVETICHESYFLRAIALVPFRIQDCREFRFIQAFGLLTLYSLTISNYSAAHRYLALYHALVAQDGFHDERRWPKSLSTEETENRRRVFWTMYRLEVYSACLSGHVVRLPAAQAAVLYPSGPSEVWNYHTDLHRLLEQSLSIMRPALAIPGMLSFANLAPQPEDLSQTFSQLKLRKSGYAAGLPVSESREDALSIKIHEMQSIFTETLLSVMILLRLGVSISEVATEVDQSAEKMTSMDIHILRRGDIAMIQQLLGTSHLLFNAARMCDENVRRRVKKTMLHLTDFVRILQHELNPDGDATTVMTELADTLFDG